MFHGKDEGNGRALSAGKKYSLLAGCAVVVLLGAGCVPQDKYDDLLTSYRTLKEENVQLQSELDGLHSTAEMYQSRIGASGTQLSQLESENQRLRGEIDSLEGDYRGLLSRLDSMEFGPLPDDVNQALQELAAKYPNLLTYDPRLGMVRFSSDLTFALGSADITPEAAASLAEFAKIANAASLTGYELRLVGHTDTVPIKNAATAAKHPTNMHLSVHRSISVAESLKSAGVAANRVQVAGYGPYRPVVQNGASGAKANRRVEIYMVPMKGQALAELPADTGADSTPNAVNAIPEEPMK